MGPVEEWHNVRTPLDLKISDFDTQIRMDIERTHPMDHWFDPHRESICKLLNAFANTNIGFGYPQGLNFLVFPLWKVYYQSSPKWAMHDTFYSLQHLVGALLSVYPIHKSDNAALDQIELICAIVKLRTSKKYPKLRRKLFSEEYSPFIISIVSKMVPTLFANVYTVNNCILLWDNILMRDSILDAVVQCVVSLFCINHNAIMHLPLINCMCVIQESAPYTVSRMYGELLST
jgi:hypothetical protein